MCEGCHANIIPAIGGIYHSEREREGRRIRMNTKQMCYQVALVIMFFQLTSTQEDSEFKVF